MTYSNEVSASLRLHLHFRSQTIWLNVPPRLSTTFLRHLQVKLGSNAYCVSGRVPNPSQGQKKEHYKVPKELS